jgi:hypothetical protein
MKKIITSTKDSSIYQRLPNNNCGVDEILDIGKVKLPLDADLMYASSSARSLLYFDLSEIGTYPPSSKYFLNMYIANSSDLRRTQTIDIHLISSSWDE